MPIGRTGSRLRTAMVAAGKAKRSDGLLLIGFMEGFSTVGTLVESRGYPADYLPRSGRAPTPPHGPKAYFGNVTARDDNLHRVLGTT
jgi:hypothetical protein